VRQQQFLKVLPLEEALARFREAFDHAPLPPERVALARALGRVLAADAGAPVDVPGFTRSDVDGFAVHAGDTYGASEEAPRRLALAGDAVATGAVPQVAVPPGGAIAVATGAVLPRGGDAVVMVEETDTEGGALLVRRAVAPGANVSGAGSDLARGETVLRGGQLLSSRETGLLAALGIAEVDVVRRPRVALFSTGDELLAPGEPPVDGKLYDSNGRILADATLEAGGDVVGLGIARDEPAAIEAMVARGLPSCDLVLLSGGTSKGPGDQAARVLARIGELIVHGVALKPGKPVAIGVVGGKPVVVLPGFPTSAIFTFHAFVAPWIRGRAGLPPHPPQVREARLARAVISARGRTEFDLVHLVEGEAGLVAYPLGKGSGSLTTFARADGFHAIPAGEERREEGERVAVTLLGPLRLADLVVIGSHCTGLDLLLSLLLRRGFTSKVVAAGSTAGLDAARRGECDVAPIHLPGVVLPPHVRVVGGYGRRQGVVSRDGRGEGRLVNRNAGSGTRMLIDGLLAGRRPDGYTMEVRSHQAVAEAVRNGRADWGVCIENVAKGLSFRFLADERFEFAVPERRAGRAAVRAFADILNDPATRRLLAEQGFSA